MKYLTEKEVTKVALYVNSKVQQSMLNKFDLESIKVLDNRTKLVFVYKCNCYPTMLEIQIIFAKDYVVFRETPHYRGVKITEFTRLYTKKRKF